MSSSVPTHAEEALGAEVCCARLEPLSPATIARARPALAAALERSVRLPPIGLVADLTTLLESTSPRLSNTEVPGLSLRRFDDRVVGPMVVHRRRTALTDAYAALAPNWRGPAVAALAERICEELEPEGGWWEPAALRSWLHRTDEEGWDLALAALSAPDIRDDLQQRLAGMAGRPPMDWSAADVHLIRNLPSLATQAQRLFVRQVLEASSALDGGLPKTVRPRTRAGPVTSAMADEDTFPAGGFSALTTSGSPENLVASELVYMDDDKGESGIDLFDVRFTEGELLFYTRDESAHSRERRRIFIALAADLTDARVKDASVPWQRIVVVLGALHAVVERLVKWLGDAELQIAIRPIGSNLDSEATALGLVLREWVDAGVVSIDPVDKPADFESLVEEARQVAETDFVWISANSEPPELPVKPWRFEIGPKRLEGWTEAANALASYLA